MKYQEYTDDAVALLKALIATPSVSRQEEKAAEVLAEAQCTYRYGETGKFVDSRAVCPHDRRRQAVWFGQQRLRGRAGIFTSDVQIFDIQAPKI